MQTKIEPQEGFQKLFLASTADITIGGAAAGVGKMLCIDTLIPTPNGFVRNGDLKAGHIVFGEHGQPVKVLKVHPITITNGYKLVFDDNSEVVACSNHLWQTHTAIDLEKLTKRGSCSPTIKTTQQIADTLKCLRKTPRLNHAIPVCHPVQIKEKILPLDPYLLGLWLGDGGSRDCCITTADEEVLNSFNSGGFKITKWNSDKYTYGAEGLRTIISSMGLRCNKYIPSDYLFSSVEQRKQLLRGLLDSDGSSGTRNEFNSINKELADGVCILLNSLGIKTNVRVNKASIYGKDCGIRYRLSFTTSLRLFKLERKLSTQKHSSRRTTKFRYIAEAIPVEGVQMRCITVDNPTGLYLCSRNFIPTHNTWCELAEPLRNRDVPRFNAITFRRTTEQIRNPGGLWDKSTEMYYQFGGRPREQQLEWNFPKSGVTFKFSHLQHEKNIYDHDGTEYCLIQFDELHHFTKKMFFYLLSRNRSTCGIKPYVRASCNPDPESFVADLIEWWIDQDERLPTGEKNPMYGYPIIDRVGKVRYFLVDEDQYVWGDSKQEVLNKCLHLFNNPAFQKTNPENLIKSLSFIPGSIYDNKALLSKDPGYLANLMAQDETEKTRLLLGNWKIKVDPLCIFSSMSVENMFTNLYPSNTNQRYITCDAARFGQDLCTIFVWYGWKVVKLLILTKSDAQETVDVIEKERERYSIVKGHVIIDQDGVGGGVVKLGRYIGFSGGNPPMEEPGTFIKENYKNLKTQFYYRYAERVNNDEVSMPLSNENVVVDGFFGVKIKIEGKMYDVRDLIKQQHRAIKKKDIDAEGKKQINSKEEQKALLNGMSPDLADGPSLRVWFEMKSGNIVTGSGVTSSILDRIR